MIRRSGNVNKEAAVARPLLRSFFIEELKSVYWLEKKLLNTIPKMQKVAGGLEHLLTGHFEKAKRHIQRIDRVFGITGEKATGKKCEAMENILQKIKILIDIPVVDGGNNLADLLHKLEQYETKIYADLAYFAKTLGMVEALDILNSIVGESKQQDAGSRW